QLLFPAAATSWIVHVAQGHVVVNNRDDVPRAEAGETLLIDFAQSGGAPLVLNGGGELVLVKLTRLD
ncbi:MAG TPA: hypothetical protein VN153_00885, partial [Tahibacter sp.]|nr:hypothetical protein [Tahibacter sp.]